MRTGDWIRTDREGDGVGRGGGLEGGERERESGKKRTPLERGKEEEKKASPVFPCFFFCGFFLLLSLRGFFAEGGAGKGRRRSVQDVDSTRNFISQRGGGEKEGKEFFFSSLSLLCDLYCGSQCPLLFVRGPSGESFSFHCNTCGGERRSHNIKGEGRRILRSDRCRH